MTVGSVCSTSTLGGANGVISCSLTASPTASGTNDSMASSTRYSLPTKFCKIALGALPLRNPGISTRCATRRAAAFICFPTRSGSTSSRSTISPFTELSCETFNPHSFVSRWPRERPTCYKMRAKQGFISKSTRHDSFDFNLSSDFALSVDAAPHEACAMANVAQSSTSTDMCNSSSCSAAMDEGASNNGSHAD